MSCRHDLANGTCIRCYPSNPDRRADADRIDPGPESDYEPNLDGPGAVPASTPPECAYFPPEAFDDPTTDHTAWIERHGCHAAATWAILTPGKRPADATYACAAHLAELCEDGDTVRRVDGEAGR